MKETNLFICTEFSDKSSFYFLVGSLNLPVSLGVVPKHVNALRFIKLSFLEPFFNNNFSGVGETGIFKNLWISNINL